MAQTTPDPLCSVIVCHHAGELWRGCFETLKQSTGVTFELIVVSSNPQPEWEGQWFRVLHVLGGPAHKRNVGVSHARGSVIVFLDDDTEVSPYTLYEFWRGFQVLPQAGMLFARIYNGERRTEFDDCGSWLTPSGFLYARAGDAQWIESNFPLRCLASKSAGCAIRREVFVHVGGFDASYYILGEETDLAWRVWLSGQEVWYWPHAVLWHYFNTSVKPVQDYYTKTRIHRYGARNYLRLLSSNLGALRLILILPGHLCGWLLAACGFALRGQGDRAWLLLAGLGEGVVSSLSRQGRAKRRRVQSTRCVSDRVLMRIVMRRVSWAYYLKRMAQYIWGGLHG